jgi:hypothetical protein
MRINVKKLISERDIIQPKKIIIYKYFLLLLQYRRQLFSDRAETEKLYKPRDRNLEREPLKFKCRIFCGLLNFHLKGQYSVRWLFVYSVSSCLDRTSPKFV